MTPKVPFIGNIKHSQCLKTIIIFFDTGLALKKKFKRPGLCLYGLVYTVIKSYRKVKDMFFVWDRVNVKFARMHNDSFKTIFFQIH